MNLRKRRMLYRSPEGRVVIASMVLAVIFAGLFLALAMHYQKVQSCVNGTIENFISDNCSEVIK